MPNSHPDSPSRTTTKPSSMLRAARPAAGTGWIRYHHQWERPVRSSGASSSSGARLCGSIRLAHVSRITGELLGPYRYDHPSWYDDALSEKQSPAWWRATYLETLSPDLFVEPDEVRDAAQAEEGVMNPFQDLEHALLTGVVLATLRSKGITANVVAQ